MAFTPPSGSRGNKWEFYEYSAEADWQAKRKIDIKRCSDQSEIGVHRGLWTSPYRQILPDPAVVEALGEALGELGENRLLLVGHSYGARLALDLMGAGSFNLIGGILLSLPTSWGSSPRFKDGIRAMGLSEVKIDQESDFKSYWRKILPLYFSSGVPSVSAEIALTTKTFWKASQKMTEGLPTLDLTATALANRRQVPILYLEGDEDARLPAGNMGTLQNAFPFWDYHLLSNCGHFPMIERPVETLAEAGEFISKIGIGKL